MAGARGPFSRVNKIACVLLFLPMTDVNHWPFHQLEIKAFLHGNHEDEVYMEHMSGFVAQGSLVDLYANCADLYMV